MTFKEMQDEVLSLLMDQSPNIIAGVPDYINTAVQQIAEDIKFAELRQVSSVTTSISTYYVNMPTTFSSRLQYAGDANGKYTILDRLIDLVELYPSLDESGDIEYVVCEGGVLYYQPIPTTAVSVTCIGYHVPDTLVSDSDTPSFIPNYLQREAIVNKAASIGYSIIEAGVESEKDKVNTRVFSGLAEIGINKIRAYVSRRRPVVGTTNWRY